MLIVMLCTCLHAIGCLDTDKVNITSLSEEFESRGVTVLLEWTDHEDSTRAFNLIVTPM